MLVDGKVAVITGAAGGIGRAAAKALAGEGAAVLLVDTNQDLLDEAAAAIEGAAGVHTVVADVTANAEVERYMSVAVERSGRLDVLFNNAGIEGQSAPIVDADEREFDRVIAVNVKGVWLNLKYALQAMRRNGHGGSIVNTSSGLGQTGIRDLGAYVASKHAVIGLTRTAALEVARDGIRVNAICPGPVETRMMRSLEAQEAPDDPESVHTLIAQSVPLGRYGTPREIAQLVVFLASDRASFINGAAIAIDGGTTAD